MFMQEPIRLRVGWDLDGVGYVFGESVRMFLASIGRAVDPMTDEFCKEWNFFKAWKMHEDEFGEVCNAGVDAGYVFGDHPGLTRPNFFEAMRAVKEMGHTNVVITHRYQGSPGNAEKNTYKWLEQASDYIDEIHFGHDKTQPRTDIFVEDNKGNYDNLVAAGIHGVLINRPWNLEPGDDRNRIDDISEYPAQVAALSERLSSVV